MVRSTDRILTTHVGSLPRPKELLALYKNGAPEEELHAGLKQAVADVVRKQTELGIDIVNDGEYGNPSSEEIDYAAFGTYQWDRLGGYEMREVPQLTGLAGKDMTEFADFYASPEAARGGRRRAAVSVGPITYTGQALVARDIANLEGALGSTKPNHAFISAVEPDLVSVTGTNDGFYATAAEEAFALGDALREEYRAIADAGFNVQLDDPVMVNIFEKDYSIDWDLKSFRKWAESHVELINHTLEGIPAEQVRYHVCWGSWKGPHSSDLPLKDMVDLMLQINASQYSIEAANPMHEHEWEVWKDVKLPDGKLLLPGVVTHKTNVLEHPELVAQRIVRYAEVVGRENVIASTDCGMGGRINPGIAWAKLKALTDGAALATKQLWK